MIIFSLGFNSAYVNEKPISYDGWDDYSLGKELRSLWMLVLKLSKEVVGLLLSHLPAYENNIPEEVLEKLEPHQL